MRNVGFLLLATAISTSFALAQTSPPAQPGPGNKAINSPDTTNANAPVAGANSFTEAQARSRIESSGYTAVSNLHKDDKGIWRGTATRAGKSVEVSLDFQGNTTPR
jgi:hypothetical protein